MKTPTPTPAQAVVLEALRIAEEAKHAVDEYVDAWLAKPPTENLRKTKTAVVSAIDRLAALVQPPEAPAENNVASVNGMPMCVHPNERTSIGPTTSQINHFCPDCKQSWVTFPAPAAVALATMTSTPAPQVPSEAARLVGGEAALVAQAQALIAQIVDVAGEHTPMGKALSKLSPIIAALASGQAAPTDAPGEPDDMLTVAHIESEDGAGTLTLEFSQLGDLASMVGEDDATYTVRIAGMKRADFEALGEFDGF